MIKRYEDTISLIYLESLFCGLITETHTVTCSLISNHTGCSQSRLNIKQIPHLKVEDLILRLPKPQPAQPLASPEGTAQEGTPPLYLMLNVCSCVYVGFYNSSNCHIYCTTLCFTMNS